MKRRSPASMLSPSTTMMTPKRDYDLPFHNDRANRFLILLIGLMTYLALLATAGGMVLTEMANRWTVGLAHQLTIEIPGTDGKGVRLSPDQQQERVELIIARLAPEKDITNVTVKNAAEVGKLVEPWLGANQTILDQVPLPTLITVTTQGQDDQLPERLTAKLSNLAPGLRVDSHQSWLADVLRLTGALSFSAYLIGFITAITTISAVGGAVRVRMAAYQEQLEILHLIGATDEYMTRQFQRHALQLALAGAGAGFILAMLTLLLLDQLSGAVSLTLVPALILSYSSFLILLTIPMLTCVMTVLTTRLTVLQSLKDMP